MPLTQPKRDNPLVRSYVDAIGLSSKALAKVCGVSHSQMYMARTRNVGADNAEKISRGIAGRLGLSEEDRLYLKAEIMGHPDNLVRAYLGDGPDAGEKLDMDPSAGAAVVHLTKPLNNRSGKRAVRALEQMGAPAAVVEAVRARILPYRATPGRRTHDQSGLEMRNRRAESLFYFRLFKPKTEEALNRSGLSKKELYSRAGVGKETLRQAFYGRVGDRSARDIAAVLGEAVGLSEDEMRDVKEELKTAPRKTF